MKSRFPIYVRAIAIVMLLAMFHYMVGYRLMYSLGILYAKNEAKECMANKTIGTKRLALSPTDYNSLKWTEKGQEFSFNNEMYDVVGIQKCGDIYTITAYTDNPETELVTAFHNFESELFHPDQTAKGTKSAENILASFQKDFTPASEFRIHIFPSTGLLKPSISIQEYSINAPNSIWHPPAIC